jgi:hypothetical protein
VLVPTEFTDTTISVVSPTVPPTVPPVQNDIYAQIFTGGGDSASSADVVATLNGVSPSATVTAGNYDIVAIDPVVLNSDIESVKLELFRGNNNMPSYEACESNFPYAISGDNDANRLGSIALAAGAYDLRVTAYELDLCRSAGSDPFATQFFDINVAAVPSDNDRIGPVALPSTQSVTGAIEQQERIDIYRELLERLY